MAGGMDLDTGVAICHSLASQGINIVMIGKKYDRLLDLSNKLEA